MMTLEQIESELKEMVRDLGLTHAEIEVEQNWKWVHVLLSCDDFRGKSAGERDNLIWKEFERRFDDETILSITQCYLLTPEERSEALSV